MTRRSPSGLIRTHAPGALIAIVVITSLSIAAVPASASSATADASAFVVALDAEGNADVTLRLPVDIGAAPDQETIQRIERNHSTVAEEFRDRLSRVAERTQSATGRSMQVSAASVHVSAGESTTIVELTATWEGLAAVDGDRIVMTEPFASGFRPSQRFVVRAPEGYTIASTTPDPDERLDGAVAWSAGSDLGDFRVEFAPDDGTNGDTTTAGPMPGFGLGVAVAALLIVGSLGRFVAKR